VLPRLEMTVGRDARIAPTASFRNGSRVILGEQVQVGGCVTCSPTDWYFMTQTRISVAGIGAATRADTHFKEQDLLSHVCAITLP
jgi:hypothetical protein